MSNVAFNVGKGRAVELHHRVVTNDPANSAIIVVPLEASGLVDDATMIDYDTLAAVLAGASSEQTTIGRKTLTDAELVAFTTNDTNDRNEVAIPEIEWAAATGNELGKVLFCYDPDTTSGDDSNVIPLYAFDFVRTPDGSALVINAGNYALAN